MGSTCSLCGCELHRNGDYASPSVKGRSHATKHHFVAERFFGRSRNRPNDVRDRIFETDPWGVEGKTAVFCYECHEELLHNLVLLPGDLDKLRRLFELRGLAEKVKVDRANVADRILLLHEVLQRGIEAVLVQEEARHAT